MQREHLVWLPQIAKAILLLLCASIVAALDTAVVFRLPSVFASVNVPLIAALAATLFMGSTNGVVLAFVLGVLCDVMLANALGARSIPLVVFAAVVGLMEARFSREHPLTWAVLGALGSVIHDILYFCVLAFSGYLPLIWADLIRIAGFGALINGVLSVVCLMPLYLWWRSGDHRPATGLG
ncbi:MAG: rod shape-determining protein MreD [Firmicutes bacterium]|nr:rod shape-determining protein MreD [Bacillota bacterium]